MMYTYGGVIVIGILAILAVAGIVLLSTRRSLADGATLLTPRRLVEGYVFTVVLVSMLLVSTGLADLVRAGVAKKIGLQSSYRPEQVTNEPQKPGETKYEYDATAPRRDALSGSAEFGVGLIVGILHLVGLRRLGRTEPVVASPVYRLFLIIGLIIYTSAVLVYAVASIKDWLIFRYIGPPSSPSAFDRPLPGDQIAGLAGFLPVWGLLVRRLFRLAQSRSVTS